MCIVKKVLIKIQYSYLYISLVILIHFLYLNSVIYFIFIFKLKQNSAKESIYRKIYRTMNSHLSDMDLVKCLMHKKCTTIVTHFAYVSYLKHLYDKVINDWFKTTCISSFLICLIRPQEFLNNTLLILAQIFLNFLMIDL